MVGEFNRFRSKLQRLTSRLHTSFSQEKHLRNDRFALPHELAHILSPSLDGINVLLGEASYHHVLKVSRTNARRELGNVLVVAPTRGGKGLLAESQLLTWQGSVIVNDIKGELFNDTIMLPKIWTTE
jgi:type IV secretory pathway TraG/TraD family ATPase VirD4